MELGLKSGVAQEVMVEVISKTLAGLGHITTAWPEKALIDNSSPALMLDFAREGIGLALKAGASCEIPLSTGSVAWEFYNFAGAAGHGEDDWTTGIFRAMKSISKIS